MHHIIVYSAVYITDLGEAGLVHTLKVSELALQVAERSSHSPVFGCKL